MKILVVNCGSSSLKYQLIDSESEEVSASGQCERIGLDGIFSIKVKGEKLEKSVDIPDHSVAMKTVLDALVAPEHGILKSLDEIEAIGHRVVHGGEKFSSSVLIDENVISEIEECSALAPLHNPANILGIRACQKIMPGVPNVAVFDTAFHQTMPPKAYLYGIPKKYYEQYGIRRYGFHGTSHSFVSERLAQLAGLDINNSKMIICHIGSGASISAVVNGKSVDTSMGMTPLEGLVMGTRSGDIDPAIMEFIAHKEGKDIDEIMTVLNKKSGVYGLSNNLSSDFRDLEDGYNRGDEHCIRTMNTYCYRVAKYIGSYVAAMNGVDVICFTAGVGENAPLVRSLVCEHLGFLGVSIDEDANHKRGEEIAISTPDSKTTVMVIPTNEELAIARETVSLVK